MLLLVEELRAYVAPRVFWVPRQPEEASSSHHARGNREAHTRSQVEELNDVMWFPERSAPSSPGYAAIFEPSEAEVERHLHSLLEVAAILRDDPRKKVKL